MRKLGLSKIIRKKFYSPKSYIYIYICCRARFPALVNLCISHTTCHRPNLLPPSSHKLPYSLGYHSLLRDPNCHPSCSSSSIKMACVIYPTFNPSHTTHCLLSPSPVQLLMWITLCPSASNPFNNSHSTAFLPPHLTNAFASNAPPDPSCAVHLPASLITRVVESESGVGVGGVACFQLELESVFSKLLESESGVGVGILKNLPTPQPCS